MKFNYVLFDFDGTLVDSELVACKLEVEIKRELGFPISLDEQIATFNGLSRNHPETRKLMAHLPANYWEMFSQRLRDVYKRELKVIPGAFEVLENFKLPKCLVSNSEQDSLAFKLKITGLDRFFSGHAFDGEMVERPKPDPDLFLLAIQKMGWPPSGGLAIEDSTHGVHGAKAAGLTVCGFLGGGHIRPGHAEKLVAAGADFLVHDLREIEF